MQLKKEIYTDIDNYEHSYEKQYYKNGLLKSENVIFLFREFEYDRENKLIVEKITDTSGNGSSFYKKEYQYESGITRIFEYKIGYTDLKDQFVRGQGEYSHLSNLREGPLPIYPLNELLSIKELVYNKDGMLISEKLVDLKTHTISELKISFDSSGNLQSKLKYCNNQISSSIIYDYKNGVLESILTNDSNLTNDSAIAYYKYDDEGKVFEINYYELVDNVETLHSKTTIKYENNKIVNKTFEIAPGGSFEFDRYLFYILSEAFEEENRLILDKDSCGISTYSDINNEYKIIYDENNKIAQTTSKYKGNIFNTEIDSNGLENIISNYGEIEQNNFFIYKYIDNTKEDSDAKYDFFNKHSIEYVDEFSVRDSKFQHLSTTKFEYY